MAWDSDLQVFGAQQEDAYVNWSAANVDEMLEPTDLRGTKAGYERWVERTVREEPEKYARARAQFDLINPFAHYFVEQTWKPWAGKRDKKIKAPEATLWLFAGEALPETYTIRDGKAVGGYRTIPKTAATVGDYDDSVTEQEKEHAVWGEEIAADRARANAMLREVHGDRSVLMSTLVTVVAPTPPPSAPAPKVPEPV